MVAICACLADLDAQALTDTAWSLAVLGHRDQRLLAAICHQAFTRIEDFGPANLAITAWSFATLSYRDDLIMKRLSRQALDCLPEFEAQSLANMAWACATMRFKDDVLMHHITGQAVRKVSDFSPQHVANTCWAFATLGRRSSSLFGALESQAVRLLLDPMIDFCPLDLALCAWAFAWLDHVGPNSPLFRSIAPVALRRLEEFSTQQIANMMWGFDHANYVDLKFYDGVGRWCCEKPLSFWGRAAGEELVSVLTALQPYAAASATDGQAWQGWAELEAFFLQETLAPLATFLTESHKYEDYTQGLRRLRTYHGGALYTGWLFGKIGITYLGNGDDMQTRCKVDDLIDFYLLPPEPRWLPDGYSDDDVQANRAEIPGLLELLDVRRRVQPSSHFIALHLSAELVLESPSAGVAVGAGPVDPDANARPDAVGFSSTSTSCTRNVWRVVPTRPPRRSGLVFVRGDKFEGADLSGDGEGALRTSTLRDYQRKHHAEVSALTQLTEIIAEMEAEVPSEQPIGQRVTGWVEFFIPHYPCSSCVGAMVQFCVRYPRLAVRVGHDDWRHWIRRLDARWDPTDHRQHNLSINAKNLRELDRCETATIPESYRLALRGALGGAGINPSVSAVGQSADSSGDGGRAGVNTKAREGGSVSASSCNAASCSHVDGPCGDSKNALYTGFQNANSAVGCADSRDSERMMACSNYGVARCPGCTRVGKVSATGASVMPRRQSFY